MSDTSAIITEIVDYALDETPLRGFLAHPAETSSKLPAVVIIHDWMGEGEYPRDRAKLIAELGYVGFTADIYGTEARPKDMGEAAQFAQKYYADRSLMRARAQAAFDEVAKQPCVESTKIVAIGYCFGGTVALELARSGADTIGTVVLHGGLTTPNPDDGKNIKGKVLALQGGDDPWVNDEQVQQFVKEMRDAKVDWELVQYGGCAHAFTNPNAGDDISKGMAYNPKADKRSWTALQNFLAEVFA